MQTAISWLESLAQQIPVTWFVFLGALIEEVIAPIPSPLVMMLGGSIAASQNSPLSFLLLLTLIGSLSKTLGSLIIYVVADKAENIFVGRFGKFLGVSRSDTEGLGKFLNKNNKDNLMIFLLRAVPIMPTAPVSVIAGLIKIKLKTYLLYTFLGLVVRNLIYLYLGYTSAEAIESLSQGFDSLEKIGYFILSIFGGLTLLWMYRKRQKGSLLSTIDSALNYFKRKAA